MRRMTWFLRFCLVFAVALLVGSSAASAAPPPQSGSRTLAKANWGVRLTYPRAWSVITQQAEHVVLANRQTGSVFVIARDPGWAARDVDLSQVFTEVLGRANANVRDVAVDGSERRMEISGAAARVRDWTGYDVDNGTDMTGYVLVMPNGGQGIGVICGSAVERWERDRPVIEQILESIRIEGKPADADTRNAPRGSARTRATPAVGSAPGFVSGREAFALAEPLALEWAATATPATASCLRAGDASGRCRDWAVEFARDESDSGPGVWIRVTDGQVNESSLREITIDEETRPPEGWIDSTDAFDTFLAQGGAGFLERHPGSSITLALRNSFTRPGFAWWIDVTDGADEGPGASWSVWVDAATGSVSAKPAEYNEHRTFLTAREAVEVAQEAMAEVAPDAQVSTLLGMAGWGDPGFDEGRCANWYVDFSWQELAPGADMTRLETYAYSTRVADGKVSEKRSTSLVEPWIADDWGDSPAALDAFLASDDYAAFAELYPEHGLVYKLEAVEDSDGAGGGDAERGPHLWEVRADVESAEAAMRLRVD